MIDQKVDRSELEQYLANLCILHAGRTFTNAILTHLRDQVRNGEFSYDAARQKRIDVDRTRIDNLVEKQGTYEWNFTHPRFDALRFHYESWLVKRHWRYVIIGTSVAAIDDPGDEYSGALYRPDCELCGHVSWGIQGLTGALEVAYLHWLDKHAVAG